MSFTPKERIAWRKRRQDRLSSISSRQKRSQTRREREADVAARKADQRDCIPFRARIRDTVKAHDLMEIPHHVIADALRRAAYCGTPTEEICGDPRPGQSALDKLIKRELQNAELTP